MVDGELKVAGILVNVTISLGKPQHATTGCMQGPLSPHNLVDVCQARQFLTIDLNLNLNVESLLFDASQEKAEGFLSSGDKIQRPKSLKASEAF